MKIKTFESPRWAAALSWPRSIVLLIGILLASSPLFAQNKTVAGRVVDSQNDPLIGVSIVVKGSDTGTVSDLEGRYALNASAEATLDFTYIGMTTQAVKVGSQSIINIVLKDDAQLLSETVVIGYGSARKRDLTGSITNINPHCNLSATIFLIIRLLDFSIFNLVPHRLYHLVG